MGAAGTSSGDGGATAPEIPACLSLPNRPVVSSHGTGWHGLDLEHHFQPASHIPEYVPHRHVVCINLGAPVTLDRRVDGRAQTVAAVPRGEIGLYPAGIPQQFQWYGEAEFIYLYLDPALIFHAAEALGFPDPPCFDSQLNIESDGLVYQISLALLASLQNGEAGGKLYVDTMANALAVHLLSRYAARGHVSAPAGLSRLSQAQVKCVTDYIHAHLDQEIRLAELARLVHLSEFHFARLFKQSLGFALHQYHIRCRVDRAQQLLLTHRLSIAQIAYLVGFSSQSHLHYHFKRCLGITPKALMVQR